jgi:hypothetical protein
MRNKTRPPLTCAFQSIEDLIDTQVMVVSLRLHRCNQILSHKPIVPCKRLAVRNFRILMWCAHVAHFIVTEENWKPFQKIRPRPAASAYIVQESCMKFRYVKRE